MTLLLATLFLGGTAAAMTPAEAVTAALAHDPALAAAEARVDAGKGALSGASWLRHNPRVSGRLGADRLELEASQAVSLSGEGLAAARSARSSLDAAEAALDRARLVTAAEARRAWLRAAVAEADVEIAAAELAGATRLREAAVKRVAAGESADFEVRLARLEEARAVGLMLRARASLAAARATLAAITGDPAAAAHGDPLAAAPAPGTAGVRDDVRAAEAAVDAARAALARERAATVPAVELGVFYEQEAGHTVVGPTLGVEVPLWQRNPAGRGSARGELARAEAEAASLSARATAEQRASSEQMRDLEPLTALLGDDPAGDATAVLAGVEVAWRAGELDIAEATLLRARALDGRRAWVEARAAVAEARIATALAEGTDTLIP
ncbi:MAG: hypothetical protein EXR71_14910 [Myxococcales bacterium]|nr:hypothetical protein [Myxococcales bacterium]